MARKASRWDFYDRLLDAYEAKHGNRPSQETAGKLAGKTQGAAKKWAAGGLPHIDNAVTMGII